ncbi:CgeB family protein [Aquabacterium sp.]|uniref:CgeB family protein n=1 Tax=Aquabacterium sp. TaxID=1872578 RepID=UPI002E320FC3|nr:glycosyltransferase [Aquabacterium sp.]HEX5310230.1 glycosyltransferase [Aquabacterium sp.]
MKSLNILYLGVRSGTCLDRARALQRLGHQVTQFDPRHMLPRTGWTDRVTWHLGGQYFGPWLARALNQTLKGQTYDLCLVDSGEWMTPAVVRLLKRYATKVISYCIDDPTGPRDWRRFTAYRRALPFYDLVVVMRERNVQEVRNLGAKNVLRVFMSADEVSHAPRVITPQDQAQWQAQVLFLGTWMPERGPFMLELIRRGVPLTIQGSHWAKAPEWAELQPYWRGDALAGDDYARAIQCAQINLGMLSKGNRDLHTTRSMEVPALGGFLCAERTSEHESLYQDGVEAVFWKDAAECAQLCTHWLSNESGRKALSQAGRIRLQRNGHLNENVMQHILSKAYS